MNSRLLFGLLACLLSALDCLGAAFPFFDPLTPPRAVQVMAHRGASGQAPENTKPALERCVQDLFEWAEVDLRTTRDGKLILSHDDSVPAPVGGSRKIREHTLEELKALDIGSSFAPKYAGVGMLSLKECFDLARGRLNLYLDCKDVSPEQLAREILEAKMERQVVVYDRPEAIQRVTTASDRRVATMTKWHAGMDVADFVRTNGVAAVEINADEVTPAIVQAFRTLRIKVQTKNLGQWDTPAYYDKVLEAGVDWVQTDLPEEVIARALWRKVKTRPVRISSHRGAGRYAPENTLPAFEKAIRLGVDFVEFDVRTTSDDGLFLMHDGSLDRTTDGHGTVQSSTSALMAGLDAGAKFGKSFAGTKVPSLDQFLTATEGRVDLYFDAKAITPERLAEAVERHHMAERTAVYQSVEFLLRLREINPKIKAMPPLRSLEDLPKITAKFTPYAVDANWKNLSRQLIEQCHQAGILVFSDALGAHETVEDYLQAIDWGLDLIQTDHPVRVLRAIELHERRKGGG